MRTVRTIAELRDLLAPERRAGRTIGLVPTMGFFHEGHLSLMRRARAENDLVVMVCLLHGSAHPALAADDDLEYLVGRLRAVWPACRSKCAATVVLGCPPCTKSANDWRCCIPSV